MSEDLEEKTALQAGYKVKSRLFFGCLGVLLEIKTSTEKENVFGGFER